MLGWLGWLDDWEGGMVGMVGWLWRGRREEWRRVGMVGMVGMVADGWMDGMALVGEGGGDLELGFVAGGRDTDRGGICWCLGFGVVGLEFGFSVGWVYVHIG